MENITNFTVQIVAIWLVTLAGAWMMKSTGIFIAPVIATAILSVIHKIEELKNN